MNAHPEPLEMIREDVERWMRGEAVDVVEKHRPLLDAVGVTPFLCEIFSQKSDRMLDGWMTCLTSIWVDLPFESWKDILRQIDENPRAVYQFVWFASSYLGIDMGRVISDDPGVSLIARGVVKVDFPRGGPKVDPTWVREYFADLGFDVRPMWRRLAAEGAPMVLDPVEFKGSSGEGCKS